MDVRMASLDEDQDGVLDDDEIERYLEIGEKLVDATQGFASNNGIVGGLILAVVFPVAIEYDVGLYPAAGSPGLDVAAYYTKCVAAVCLYASAVIAFTLVGASARLYTRNAQPGFDRALSLMDHVTHALNLGRSTLTRRIEISGVFLQKSASGCPTWSPRSGLRRSLPTGCSSWRPPRCWSFYFAFPLSSSTHSPRLCGKGLRRPVRRW